MSKLGLKTLFGRLGRAGLKERLSDTTVLEGVAKAEQITDFVKGSSFKREPYLGDDTIPDTDLYNSLGTIYPNLSLEQREEATRAVLRQLDGINLRYVQINHTPYIREPLLVSGLTSARGIYWPGLHMEDHRWKDKSFEQIRKELMNKEGLFKIKNTDSDFFLAYSLLRTDFTDFGAKYAEAAHPEFLDRVIKGIVELRVSGIDPEEIKKGRERLREILPTNVQEAVERHISEADWVDPKKFR